ncbi:MAG: tRNA lysidine(34) synthetase TilS [Methylotenera sp.]|nr:tRNA lysidine(34) synthetase TilS [Methylotenera sp.]
MENSKKLLKSNASIKRAGKQALASQPVSSELHPVLSKLHSFFTQHLFADENSLASSPASKLLLALSGGLDSSALLHLLVALKPLLRLELHALHVHHGLSPNADAWSALCVEQCRALNVPIKVVHVNVDRSSKLGIEAAARQLRYQALFDERLSIQADYVVTAHHQDDQAETLMLQLMRGAGVKGLSSMAEVDQTRGLIRPLLGVSRLALYDYAMQAGIQWCDDESNDNTQYERNFVRHDVMPILQARYPSVKSVLARTASHLAEADALLDTLAEIDAQTLLMNNSVCLQGLSQLSVSRAKNLLRWWFAQHYLFMPTSDHLTEMLKQLLNAKPDAELGINIQHYTLRRYQQRAYLSVDQVNEPFDMVWNGESELVVPNGGRLFFKQVEGAGLALKFGMARLRITNRSGGERFKPDALRPTRTLKHLLQAANIPPWQRDHLPLVYWQDTLAYIPGVGVAHELKATKDELGLEITWQAESLAL